MKRLIVTGCTALALCAANAETLTLPSTAYVRDGLVAQWDGIDNAGVGQHVTSLTEWVDLVGTNKITFSGAVTVAGNYVQIPANIVGTGTCEMLATNEEVQVEVRASATKKNATRHSYYFSNMMAGLSLKSPMYGAYVTYPTGEETVEILGWEGWTDFSPASYMTYSLGTQVGSCSLDRDGKAYPHGLGHIGEGTAERSSQFILGDSDLIVFSHQALRLYSRRLSPDERKLNNLVDSIRFAGSGSLPLGIRLSPGGATLQVHVVIRPRGAAISINGAPETMETYDQWVEAGTKFTIEVASATGRRVGWGSIPEGTEFSSDGLTASFSAAWPRRIGVNSFVPTHVWTGQVKTKTIFDFFEKGNWVDAAGAAVASAPGGAMDVVFIPSGTQTVSVPSAFSVGELHIGSLANGTDAVTVEFQHTRTNEVSGGIFVYRGASVTHAGVPGPTLADAWEKGSAVILSAGGDMAIYEAAAVTTHAKGFNWTGGPGNSNQKYNQGAGHASRNNASDMTYGNTYGSILSPMSWGSAASYQGGSDRGGGLVRLMVAGDMLLDGSVDAGNGSAQSGGSDAGGSVWITCATLTGDGAVLANSGFMNTGYCVGSGGRIALEQMMADDFSAFSGKVQAGFDSSFAGNLEKRAGPGTIYWKAGKVNEVRVGSELPASKSLTDFPMPDDGNAKKVYRETALIGEKNVTFFLTADTKVYDLDLLSATSKIDLNGHTLMIYSKEHKNGRGWGDTLDNLVIKNGGEIVWPSGFVITVK